MTFRTNSSPCSLAVRAAIFALVAAAGGPAAFGAGPHPIDPRLPDEIAATILDVGKRVDPAYLDMLTPAGLDSAVPASELAAPLIRTGSDWFRQIVRPEWLPDNLEDLLVAIPDLKKSETLDGTGEVVSEVIGDYVAAEYEKDDHRLLIQENGATVSLRVEYPTRQVIGDDPGGFVLNNVARFLRVPEQELEASHVDLEARGDLLLGTVTTDLSEGWPFNDDGLLECWWWQHVRVCTDGRFFFATMMEADGSPTPPFAEPGLPDRF
jgi:hypothetical protein